MPGPDEDDDQLIARVAGGDAAAFGALVERHGRALLRVARAFTTSDAEAEDVVQETCVSALRATSTYRPGVSSVRTWLFAIARNAARRAKRHAREVPAEDLDELPLSLLGRAPGWGAETPDLALERAEGRERFAQAIASLSEKDRVILVLRDVEGLSGEEIMEVLDLGGAAMKAACTARACA